MKIRFFAGAADAAGLDESVVDGPLNLAALRSALIEAHGPEFARVLGRCSLLAEGTRLDDDETVVPDSATVDVLPPFAGG
ncbi:MAG: MoaD/ThiS family protein [Galactobacter sp.]|uniref:MoaD/ThiS family protein n=1 Tax=Galactobacter sp. TaxID=2676125 RepID=UPI0025BC1971|nr:MoaD/ThiS family protein [Galactobacter sp.]